MKLDTYNGENMTRFREPKKGKYSSKRTRFGNLLVGRRKGKTAERVAKDMQSTANLFSGTKKAKKFRSSQRRALESEIRKTKK